MVKDNSFNYLFWAVIIVIGIYIALDESNLLFVGVQIIATIIAFITIFSFYLIMRLLLSWSKFYSRIRNKIKSIAVKKDNLIFLNFLNNTDSLKLKEYFRNVEQYLGGLLPLLLLILNIVFIFTLVELSSKIDIKNIYLIIILFNISQLIVTSWLMFIGFITKLESSLLVCMNDEFEKENHALFIKKTHDKFKRDSIKFEFEQFVKKLNEVYWPENLADIQNENSNDELVDFGDEDQDIFNAEYEEALEEESKLCKNFIKLLKEKKITISLKHLKNIVSIENEINYRTAFENKIFWGNASEFEDYLKNYLDYTGDNYIEELNKFLEFLNRQNINYSANDLIKIIDEFLENKEYESFKKELGSVKEKHIEETISTMSGIEFEIFIAELYSTLGYSTKVTQASNDYGADLIIEKFGKRSAVQIKRYNSTVGVKAVQEITSAMKFYKSEKGVVISNSSFSRNAEKLAKENGVELINGKELSKLIKKAGL